MEIKRIWLDRDQKMYKKWSDLVKSTGLIADDQVDYTIGLFDGEKLIGTGSIFVNILKCLAVDSAYQNENLLTKIVQILREQLQELGYKHLFLYTKPLNKHLFCSLGFKEIIETPDLVFMEQGIPMFKEYLAKLKTFSKETVKNAGIVMNANPFTNGHRYLIQEAAKQNDTVYVFVLSEERSLFDSATRFCLVKEGVSDLDNVIVLPTEEYMVSSATFPSYFLKNQAKENVANVQARLDATLFKECIAPILGITSRYVGEEPLSPVTNRYNEALKTVFTPEITLIVLPRRMQGEEIISASRVRNLLQEKKYNEIKKLVPASTFEEIMKCKKE